MRRLYFILLIVMISLCGCSNNELEDFSDMYPNNIVYYELFIRSSFDSNNDGIGDFKGIEQNVSYFKDLGIEGIWFMPFNKSNSYHGYDIYDYMDVEEDYGTLDDFKSMLNTLNKNNIRVMMDLVVNHTSDQHPWYIESLNTNSIYRDYYVYNNSSAYSSFVGGMYDLNLGNEVVFNEIVNIAKFYLELGVSDFRLDAAKHFFQVEENNVSASNAINLSNDFIRRLKAECIKVKEDVFIVSEVLDSNLLSSQFFKGGDSAFNFDIREKLLSTASGQSTSSYSSVLSRNYELISTFNYDFIDSVFATNHDLNRISYELNKNSDYYDRQLRLVADMLLVLPGAVFIYYGDELGQNGSREEGSVLDGYDNLVYDEYRRLPLKLGNEYESSWIKTSVDNNVLDYVSQKEDKNSLYNHYKNIINIRNTTKALKYGNSFIKTNVDLINGTSFIRSFDNQNVLVIHNPSNNPLDISHLNCDEIIYSSNGSNNNEVAEFSTVIFIISNEQVEELV